MKKRGITGILLLGMALFLTGCGAFHGAGSEAGDGTAFIDAVSGNVISGSAVSGSTVSGGSVTGTAVAESDAMADSERRKVEFCRYLYRDTMNSRNLYKIKRGSTLLQCSLSGEVEKRFKNLPGMDEKARSEADLLYVNEKEIFYRVYNVYPSSGERPEEWECWRIPFKRGESELLFDQAEKMPLQNVTWILYADEHTICASESTGGTALPTYFEYDRDRGKYRIPPMEKGGDWYCNFVNGEWESPDGRTYIIFREGDEDLFVHTAGSDNLKKLQDCYVEKPDDVIGANSIFMEISDISDISWIHDLEGEKAADLAIWCYNCDTGNFFCLANVDELEAAFDIDLSEYIFFYPDLAGNKVYMEVSSDEEREDRVFSLPFSGEHIFTEEKPFRELVPMEEDDQVYVIDIWKNICFFEVDGDSDSGHREKRYCYNYETGELKRVRKDDDEAVFWKNN